jgi:hypothetical protein
MADEFNAGGHADSVLAGDAGSLLRVAGLLDPPREAQPQQVDHEGLSLWRLEQGCQLLGRAGLLERGLQGGKLLGQGGQPVRVVVLREESLDVLEVGGEEVGLLAADADLQ